MQNTLFFHNSYSRRKEPFHPQKKAEVTLYTCGPTVYHFAHIGNFRTFLFEDLLRRTLKFFGFQVKQAMNITDVDDKTIRGAIKNKSTLEEFTAPYKRAFFEDLATLGIEPVEYYPEATAYIPTMISMIQTLLDKKVAYQAQDKSVYFAIRQFQKYGALSHLNVAELKEGASERMQGDEYEKESASDFVLWKSYDPERDGALFWESPFGPGRPGWHIECSAMSMKLLGETIDIHVGAVDNLFPHHENEIAQSECCTGKTFVNLWLHAEHLIVDGRKMAKSLGNFYTLRDLLEKGYSGQEIRYALLHTHYRTPLNFSLQTLEQARASLHRLRDCVVRLREKKPVVESKIDPQILPHFEESFKKSLSDDLNISSALAALFDFIRELHGQMDLHNCSEGDAQKALLILQQYDYVLGFLPKEEEAIDSQILALVERREKARKEKEWALSDQLREEIYNHGYLIEDTRNGIRVKKR